MNAGPVIIKNYRTVFNNMYDYTISITKTQDTNAKKRYRIAGYNGGQPILLTVQELESINQKKNSQWKLTITKTSFVKKEVLEN